MKTNSKKFAKISLGLMSALMFWSSESSAQNRIWVDFTIPVKDVSGGHWDGKHHWIAFRDANNNALIYIPQFITNCDLTLIHAANERRDHCNNSIQVKITGMAYWANGAMAVDQYVGCGIVNDSWENKCVSTSTASASSTTSTASTATSTTTSTASSTSNSSSTATHSTSSSTNNTDNSTTTSVSNTQSTAVESKIVATESAPVRIIE